MRAPTISNTYVSVNTLFLFAKVCRKKGFQASIAGEKTTIPSTRRWVHENKPRRSVVPTTSTRELFLTLADSLCGTKSLQSRLHYSWHMISTWTPRGRCIVHRMWRSLLLPFWITLFTLLQSRKWNEQTHASIGNARVRVHRIYRVNRSLNPRLEYSVVVRKDRGFRWSTQLVLKSNTQHESNEFQWSTYHSLSNYAY